MDDRPVVVRDGNGSSVATIGIIAVIVIAAIIAFFVWRGSANNNPNPSNQTTINNPPANSGGTSGGSSGGSGGGSSGTKP